MKAFDDGLGLLLLHPMAGAVDKVAGQHACADPFSAFAPRRRASGRRPSRSCPAMKHDGMSMVRPANSFELGLESAAAAHAIPVAGRPGSPCGRTLRVDRKLGVGQPRACRRSRPRSACAAHGLGHVLSSSIT